MVRETIVVKFWIHPPLGNLSSELWLNLEAIKKADGLGIDGFVLSDHYMSPQGSETLETWVTLAYFAKCSKCGANLFRVVENTYETYTFDPKTGTYKGNGEAKMTCPDCGAPCPSVLEVKKSMVDKIEVRFPQVTGTMEDGSRRLRIKLTGLDYNTWVDLFDKLYLKAKKQGQPRPVHAELDWMIVHAGMKVLTKTLAARKRFDPHPKAKREEVLKLFKAGHTVKEVMKKSGIPEATCCTWRKQARKKGILPDRYPPGKREEVIKLFKEGKTTKEVSKISGISNSTCHRWWKNARAQSEELVESVVT